MSKPKLSDAGRPKSPQALKELRGTDRADRTNPDAPVVRVEAPPRPAFLDDDPRAAELYDIVVDTLMQMGVVGKPDSVALSLLADQLSRYLEIREELRKDGLTAPASGGSLKAHPLLPHLNNAYGAIHKMLIHYGLTAATRDNVNAAPLEGTTEENFEDFLKRD